MDLEEKRIPIAIATDLAGEDARIEAVEEILRRIANAGFTHIHWCFEWDGDYLYSVYEMEQIKEWMENLQLKAKSLHASKGSSRNVHKLTGHYRKDYTSDIEYNRKAGVELIKNRIDLAACIGAADIVLHLYVPHMTIGHSPDLLEKFYLQVFKSMDELEVYCREKGIRICLENLFDMPVDILEDMLDRLFAKYSPEFLGFCLDTGHANMVWRDSFYIAVERYKDRLVAVHLHDNDGICDFHQIPGQGNIDWKTTMKLIASSPYELPLVMEISCIEQDLDEFLQEAYQSGIRLTQMYLEERS